MAQSARREQHGPDRLAEHAERGDGENEHRRSRHEQEVDELAPSSRPPLDLHRGLEPGPDRRHHAARRPGEHEQAHEPDGARGCGDVDDGVLDILGALLGDGENVDDVVDDVVAHLGVLEHEPEHRDEDDREWGEREQDPVGDAGRLLREAVLEVPLARLRQHLSEVACDGQRPGQQAAEHVWVVLARSAGRERGA